MSYCSTTIVSAFPFPLFDSSYSIAVVMTKPKEKDGVTKYNVVRRPIPLDLLTLVNFTDPPTQRGTGLLRNLRGERYGGGDNGGVTEAPGDARSVYPCTMHHNARVGGSHILYAESAQARAEWQQKLEEALGLRRVVQESNKVFELETLSTDTFLVPSLVTPATQPAYHENSLTGKVTCSVPFSMCFLFRCYSRLNILPADTTDGRGLVAIGCAEGVWIGFRHDSRCTPSLLFFISVQFTFFFSFYSYAACPPSEDGDTVCDARRFWDLPCAGR
jgi:hypothetical protein